MKDKRITILSGHYGSGKTNIAVNIALDLKSRHERVAVADIDIVNPYFRTKDSEELFEKEGIRLICSAYANTNVDIPALPQEMYAVTDDKSLYAVLDVGGDERG
ncbi:MAG: P-loop NTPase, partial [Clostridia bacterium]|nr:P-loop NTPase [Clostridia bacterium]